MVFLLKHFDKLKGIELYQILKLRCAVFIVEQNCIYQDIDDKDQSCYHVMCYDDETLIATTRIVPPKISYDNYSSIGRVAVHPAYRGKGCGRELMEVSLKLCEELFPGYNIKISAQAYLIPFYESLQFDKWGEGYMEDGVPHQAMIKYSLQYGQN